MVQGFEVFCAPPENALPLLRELSREESRIILARKTRSYYKRGCSVGNCQALKLSPFMSSSYNDPEHSDDFNFAGRSEPAEGAAAVTYIWDSNGWPVWRRSADGEITYLRHDAATGLVMRRITDVNIFLYNVEVLTLGYGTLPPKGWKTPLGGGTHLTWVYEYDHLERVTRESMYSPYELPDPGLVRATTPG